MGHAAEMGADRPEGDDIGAPNRAGVSPLERSPLEEIDEFARDSSEPGRFLGGSSRPSMGVAALVIGLLSGWMFWIVHNFLDRDAWLGLLAGLVLDEWVLASGLFALVLMIWAIFAPAWLSRVLVAAYHKLGLMIALVGLLFVAASLILLLVVPALLQLGILQ
jgi:hypothetical protein